MNSNNDFSKRYEKLPVTIFSDADDASHKIASLIKKAMEEKARNHQKLVLALNCNSFLIQIYNDLVEMYKNGLSFKNVEIFSTDEFYPLLKTELQSHYRFLKEYLFDYIDIPQQQIHYLDGSLPKQAIAEHCQQYENALKEAGGIDILLTSSMAMNEPGSPYNSLTRLITLNYSSRLAAASDFFGVQYVPGQALTMGIGTLLSAKEIFYVAFGEGKAESIRKMVEGEINEMQPNSYMQRHPNIHVLVDHAASQGLTRIKTPWLAGSCTWDDQLTRKAVFWLCKKLDKPILKVCERDYIDNGLNDLVTERGPFSKINIDVFNYLQHTITGWPGGKPNADDSTRPERAVPFPKRVIVFSPHPDDDVISMGGTVARLSQQGHQIHIAYETSGNIAVFDHDAIRFLDFIRESCKIYGFDRKLAEKVYDQAEKDLKRKHPGEPDTPAILQLKAAIRRGEAKSACRYLGIPEERVHYLELPFYETGGVKKNPISEADIAIVQKLLQQVQPHQIFAAGDLSDPHGTHRVCYMAIIKALQNLHNEKWLKDCRMWLYRGAWQEWDVTDAHMAVPLSPEEVIIKREAIFKHQSQKDRPLFPGTDPREFWQRAEERNANTAVLYDKLGMAEYQAIELFVRFDLEHDLMQVK